MVCRHDGTTQNTVGTTFTASTVHRFLPDEHANSLGKGKEMINSERREPGPYLKREAQAYQTSPSPKALTPPMYERHL